jgi:hypothetical protein
LTQTHPIIIKIDNNNSIIPTRVNNNFKKKENILFAFPSINSAVIPLGIRKVELVQYLNLKNYSLYSPILQKNLFVIDPNLPLLESKPKYYEPKNTFSQISEIDLFSLDKRKVYAYHLDKKNIFDTYSTPDEAALILDGKKDSKYISKYINLERPVVVSSEKIALYFVMHPDCKI